MTFNILIFSKNRACQLELLLRSLYTLNMSASILYTFSEEFKPGYDKVIKMYPMFNFIKQTDFKLQLAQFVERSDYILFLTDDDVIIEPFNHDSPEFKEFCKDLKVATLSIGLSGTVAGKRWEWKTFRGKDRLRMWGYPMSVDSCIFRKEDILQTIKTHKMSTPNFLETELNLNIPNRPFMMSFDSPRVINNSVNQVQEDFPARTSGPSAQELEERFLTGQRLSLEDLKQKAKNLSHYRLKEEYKFENY